MCLPYLCSVTLQSGRWMPAELKYGAVRKRHIAAKRGHCDPARECGGDVPGLVWSTLCLICHWYSPSLHKREP